MEWWEGGLTPLAGGYSGETFRATGPDGTDAVVRIYQSRPDRALVDASLLRLVRGVVGAPEVVEVRPPTDETPALLVTTYVRGAPLDQVLADPPDDLDWEELGLSLGYTLGRLSGIPFVRSGELVGPDLAISAEPLPSELTEWAQHFRDTGRLAAWEERDWHALVDLVDLAEEVLEQDADRPDEALNDRVVLVHSDFNPKNILVDVDDAHVEALVDWEFAHAGSVYADFGNFTRFERDDRLEEPMIEAFVNLAPTRLRNPWEKGRAVDLWALVELAGRTRPNPVTELATTLLLAQARAGSLSAWPWAGDRVAP